VSLCHNDRILTLGAACGFILCLCPAKVCGLKNSVTLREKFGRAKNLSVPKGRMFVLLSDLQAGKLVFVEIVGLMISSVVYGGRVCCQRKVDPEDLAQVWV
jgi:hypothetical protein